MEKKKNEMFRLLLFFFLLIGIEVVQSSSHHHHHHRSHDYCCSKLFVFGDSYVDTGNSRVSVSRGWHKPYGMTFPGKPAGRASDGRVFTDFVASSIGIKSPVPYQWINLGRPELVKYGINFAYGGTGVFDTQSSYPNMTVQISFFQQLIQEGVYSKLDLNSSMALVSAAGNDYSAYLARNNGTLKGLPTLIELVVNQLALNLKRIYSLGVKKVVVNGLHPLGCVPLITALSSYQKCGENENTLVRFHNLSLKQAVEKLNNETNSSTFRILDLYSAFMSILSKKSNTGSLKFSNRLEPCCVGIDSAHACGSTNENGLNMYRVCDNPEAAFFWDLVHPTQEGWCAVYSSLQASLEQIY
ncbi:PREDICTED: GDSL esterase/lipase At5g03610-like [Nelumbo nucifera]|uniref:GDSL esterase/lipase At5g03610-like n=1 Tax=Nelumbo nucifera TaxID=4432 RepID=A0A1U8AUF8_NELNU|nr:PREDICTED: GDSL esterase/lipase At5g03610-like [Nelumbo nucifera]